MEMVTSQLGKLNPETEVRNGVSPYSAPGCQQEACQPLLDRQFLSTVAARGTANREGTSISNSGAKNHGDTPNLEGTLVAVMPFVNAGITCCFVGASLDTTRSTVK